MKLSEYIDEMNTNGKFDYTDYSNLRDMANELEADNLELQIKLSNAVVLPLMQVVGENRRSYELVYRNKNGHIVINKYRCYDKCELEARLNALKELENDMINAFSHYYSKKREK